jgi:hypothetical protein
MGCKRKPQAVGCKCKPQAVGRKRKPRAVDCEREPQWVSKRRGQAGERRVAGSACAGGKERARAGGAKSVGHEPQARATSVGHKRGLRAISASRQLQATGSER